MKKGFECHVTELELYAKGNGDMLEGYKQEETRQVRALERSLWKHWEDI